MTAKRIVTIGVSVLFVVSMVSIVQGLAAEGVFISDIKQNPSKYYNLPVKIKGVVVDVTPDQMGPKSGFFTLRDESEETIDIKTNELPAPGQSFIVEGTVTMKAGTQTPYLKELKRGGGKSFTRYCYRRSCNRVDPDWDLGLYAAKTGRYGTCL
jgi:hypothetical protein